MDEKSVLVDTKVNEKYVWVDTKVNEKYVSMDSKVDENYVWVDTKVDENYVWVDTLPSIVSTFTRFRSCTVTSTQTCFSFILMCPR